MALVTLLLSACTQVPIKDAPFWGSLGSSGAGGFHTLTSESETLNLAQWAAKWDDLSNPLGPMVCTYSSTFADWKSDIEKLCSYEKVCTYEVQQALSNVAAKFATVQETAEGIAAKMQKKSVQ